MSILPKSLLRKRHLFISLDKRQKFAIQTFILTGGLLIAQFIWNDYRFSMVFLLSILSYILTVWSLSEDIKRIEWITLFILPVFFTASVSLFYFLLPPRMIVRLFVTTVFAVGTYASLLIENIYNVAGERSIQLLRAAQSVGLLISLVVVFLMNNIIYSLRLPFWINFLIMLPLIFIMAVQSLWSTKLESGLDARLIKYSAVVSLGIGELVLVLSFWPVDSSAASLMVSAGYYSLVGIFQQYFSEKLFRNTVNEYIYVFALTLIVTLITTFW